jgi:hypothetical protein
MPFHAICIGTDNIFIWVMVQVSFEPYQAVGTPRDDTIVPLAGSTHKLTRKVELSPKGFVFAVASRTRSRPFLDSREESHKRPQHCSRRCRNVSSQCRYQPLPSKV